MPINEDGILSHEDLDFKDSAAVRAASKKLSDHVGKMKAAVDAGATDTEALKRDFSALQVEIADLKAAGRQSQIESVMGEGEGRMRSFIREDGRVHLGGTRDAQGRHQPGLLDALPTCESMRDLQRASDDRQLVRHILGEGKPTPEADRRVLEAIRALPREIREPVRAAFVNVDGSGGEWIKPGQLLTLERDMDTRISDLEMLFDEVSINEVSMISPVITSRVVPYRYGAPTGSDPANYKLSSFGTDERTFTTDGLAARVQLSRDAVEDSLFAVLPEVQGLLADGLRDGNGDAIINGYAVADGVHPDTLPGWTSDGFWPAAIPGGDIDHRRSFTGLRHHARGIAGAHADGGAYATVADYMGVRSMLSKPYGRAQDLVYLVSYTHYLSTIIKLPNVLTVDKYGSLATVVTGEVARLGGVPIVVADFMNQDLTAAGIYDGVTKTKNGMLLVARSQVKRITRRGAAVELDRNILNGMIDVVATARRGLRFMGPATRKQVAWIYNL